MLAIVKVDVTTGGKREGRNVMRSVEEIKEFMEKVNDYWIVRNPEAGDCAWERAAYFLGDMAAYEVLAKPEYLEYAVKWAEANDWNFYDNPDHKTTNADNLSCGETYMDLMEKYGIEGRMDHFKETMEWTGKDLANDYWWWVDTMHMVLHFYNRMGLFLKDERLIDKAYYLYRNVKEERGCYGKEEKLWFRDENFLPDVACTASGKRYLGNGWGIAGIVRTLEILPESSGTALIGIRLGILSEDYMECALHGFEVLTQVVLEEDGRIGWVQVVALKPGTVKKECINMQWELIC